MIGRAKMLKINTDSESRTGQYIAFDYVLPYLQRSGY